MDALLNRIRIVLVQSSHPGNIGAAARAMKTMGLRQLYLVRPLEFPSALATARAAGADDLLAEARLCETLEEAVGDCHLVFAVSARRRGIPWPELEPRAAAAQALESAAHGAVALIFGRESSGLSNQELERCQRMIRIPTRPDFRSLNLAAAVQLICYELFLASGDLAASAEAPPEGGGVPPSSQELEHFYLRLEQCMIQLAFLDPQKPRRLMHRLRRLFHRALLDRNEFNILQGFLSAVQKACRLGNVSSAEPGPEPAPEPDRPQDLPASKSQDA